MCNNEGHSTNAKGHLEPCESTDTAGVNHTSNDVSSSLNVDKKVEAPVAVLQTRHEGDDELPPVISITISQAEDVLKPKLGTGDEKISSITPKKVSLSRSDSDQDQCRICQQQTEEPLVDLGCRCRGELSQAHQSCIGIWFRTKGSNKCEICQQVAANIALPETQPSTSYWVWRIDSAYNRGTGDHERRCFSPIWIAFAILIGGLLLDVLISFSLGVSALPVNIIIGILIVLGLGTAIRLALECCQEWSARRNVHNAQSINTGFHLAV